MGVAVVRRVVGIGWLALSERVSVVGFFVLATGVVPVCDETTLLNWLVAPYEQADISVITVIIRPESHETRVVWRRFLAESADGGYDTR